jgi:peptidoglycan hydrolase CwlO-like protein
MDRNIYRMCADSELVNEAAYRPSAELAVVLGERLEDITAEHEANVEELKDRAKNFEIDANQLDDKVYELRTEIAKNEQIIAAMAAEIEYLKETAK